MDEVFHRPELAHHMALRLLDPPPVGAVLAELASSGADFTPFAGASMRRYARTIERIDPEDPIVPNGSNVQSALASLTKRGLVWSGDRGVYALEEARLAELMRAEGMIE